MSSLLQIAVDRKVDKILDKAISEAVNEAVNKAVSEVASNTKAQTLAYYVLKLHQKGFSADQIADLFEMSTQEVEGIIQKNAPVLS